MKTQDTAELLALKKKVQSLTPANQLRLAAALIEEGKYALAEAIAGAIVTDLQALRMFAGDEK